MRSFRGLVKKGLKGYFDQPTSGYGTTRHTPRA